ncbi:hypothetical protein ACFV24_01545 [Nocardia fluminea]|uniref:hypothetical protein n=1 Tax=Nocardia fluminea TaxID=134984 RepID=UPI003670609B
MTSAVVIINIRTVVDVPQPAATTKARMVQTETSIKVTGQASIPRLWLFGRLEHHIAAGSPTSVTAAKLRSTPENRY